MPLASTVRLPRDVEPVVPDHCCACLRERPGDEYELRHKRSSLWHYFFPWLLLGERTVRRRVRMCSECRLATIRMRRWRGAGILLVAALAVVAVAGWMPLGASNRQWRKILVLVVAAVALAPLVAWQVLRPPPFDLTVGKDSIEYEFANARYAELFRAANAPPALPPRPQGTTAV